MAGRDRRRAAASSACGPAREIQPRAEAQSFGELPERAETRLAWLLLAIPDLIALGIGDMVAAVG